MRWKPHVRFGRRAGETHPQQCRQGAPARSHLANTRLDEVRRRVQHETLGHRGHKNDPLYRCRRLLTKASERLNDGGHDKLIGLLEAGDPRGEVQIQAQSVAWIPVGVPGAVPSQGLERRRSDR
jgi:hypothetical protein